MNTFIPNLNNVKPLGRTMSLPDSLWLAFSGSGAAFVFTGRHCEVTVAGDSNTRPGDRANAARIAIEVNGKRVVDDLIDLQEKTYPVVNSNREETWEIHILKLSETAMSTFGIKSVAVDAASIQPVPFSDRFIEFVGDSITCGYGVDEPDPSHSFTTATEDVTKAYAYRTAQALNADYSMVSISGYGIISGYTADGREKVISQLLPDFYPKFGFSYGTYQNQSPSDLSWDFTLRQPDLIVINLGTNDDSYTLDDPLRQREFAAAYTAFLKTVRTCNPGAKILCTLGIMRDRLCPWVEKAVSDYTSETGDGNIVCLRFAVQNPEDGYSADWHPSPATHEKAARYLTEAIRRIMGW